MLTVGDAISFPPVTVQEACPHLTRSFEGLSVSAPGPFKCLDPAPALVLPAHSLHPFRAHAGCTLGSSQHLLLDTWAGKGRGQMTESTVSVGRAGVRPGRGEGLLHRVSAGKDPLAQDRTGRSWDGGIGGATDSETLGLYCPVHSVPVSPESIVPSLSFPSGPQISARKETLCWAVA